jgi:hypothetical protein
MAIQIKKAVRERVFLKLVVMGPAGSGKTYGGVGLAKGLAPTGKILVVDTENASASYYADKWDFDVVDMHAPFTAQKYMEVLAEAVKLGYEVIVFDSLSHEWAGSGGTLDKKADIDRDKGEKWGNWQDAKKPHTRFKEAWLQAPIHVVATMRSKMEYVLELNEKGKQVPRKVGLAPIQDGESEYEFGVAFEVDRDTHLATAAKDRTGLFDGRSFPLDEAIGQELAAWLASGAPMTIQAPEPAAVTAAPTTDPVHPTQAPAATTTQPSRPSSPTAPAQTAPSKPAPAINPPAADLRWPNALIELNAAMFKAGWSNDARMATAEEWKAKGAVALPQLVALLNAGLPAQSPLDDAAWTSAMDELLKVSMGLPEKTRKALVAGFEAEGPAALPSLLAEIQKLKGVLEPTTVGAALLEIAQPTTTEIPQAVATFVDSVQPDTDEANGGISADEYEVLNTIIKAHGINRDALRAYAAQSHKLLPGAGGRPTLARFKKAECEKLFARLRDTKIAADGETWSARTIRIINGTPTTTYQPVPAAS